MTDLIATVNHLAQVAEAWAVIVAAIVAAVGATRWGKSSAVQTAATAAAVVSHVAAEAVQATEQLSAGLPGGEKRADAIDRVRMLMPANVQPADGQVEIAVEAAVQRMNAAKAVLP